MDLFPSKQLRVDFAVGPLQAGDAAAAGDGDGHGHRDGDGDEAQAQGQAWQGGGGRAADQGLGLGQPPLVDLDQLYLCLRPYGRLASLKHHTSTEIAGERYAIARYEKWHGAISAKNCAHGAGIKGANGVPIQLALAYRKKIGTIKRVWVSFLISSTYPHVRTMHPHGGVSYVKTAAHESPNGS